MTRSKSLFSIKLLTTVVSVSSVLALPALVGTSSVHAQAEETEAEEQELSPEAMEILCKNFPLNSRCSGTSQVEETAPDEGGAADTPETMEPDSSESGDPSSNEMEAAPEESMEAAPEEGAEDSSGAMEGPSEGGAEQPAMEGEVSPESDPEAAPEGAITPGEVPAAPPAAPVPEGGVGQPEGMTPPTPEGAPSAPAQPSF